MKKFHILVNEQQAILYEVIAPSRSEAREIIKGSLSGSYTKLSHTDIERVVCDVIEVNRNE